MQLRRHQEEVLDLRHERRPERGIVRVRPMQRRLLQNMQIIVVRIQESKMKNPAAETAGYHKYPLP